MNKARNIVLILLVTALYYYLYLPPINLQSYSFIVFVCLFLLAVSFFVVGSATKKKKKTVAGDPEVEVVDEPAHDRFDDLKYAKDLNEVIRILMNRRKHASDEAVPKGKKTKTPADVLRLVVLGIIGLTMLATLLSQPIFHARSYSNILQPQEGSFAQDVEQIQIGQLPVVDRGTAENLGNRKMGEMGDLVSQYNIDGTYSQITVKNQPVRVSPLEYADLIKWFTNQKQGIPYYISIDMATQEAALNKLDEPIRYSKSDKFQRDLTRHLRFQYPFDIFGESNFEIDEEGRPFWVTAVMKPKVFLLGAFDSTAAIVTDAHTGVSTRYEIGDVPEWVDRVFSSDIVMQQLKWNGELKSGFINSLFGQRGVTHPTDGYNYLSLKNDIYMYTGITSVISDASNIGFVLSDLRTKETKFYNIPSAEEKSAMDSAQGSVQEKGYIATFPILINLNNRPTYFMALKDNANLTKMFALVDAQNYQSVAVGGSVTEIMDKYSRLNPTMSIDENGAEKLVEKTIEVTQVQSAVMEGNTMYFIHAANDPVIYTASIQVSNRLPFLQAGDRISLTGVEHGKDQFVIRELRQ